MPYMNICVVEPDDGFLHDPIGNESGKSLCGKKIGKTVMIGSVGPFCKAEQACKICYPFLFKDLNDKEKIQ